MSQHDLVIDNASGASVRTDLNNALQALGSRQSGSSAPSTTYAHMLWVDTTNGVVKRRNAANSGWIVVETNDETFVLARSSNTILGLSDKGKTIVATSTFTQTLTAAATLGDGWWVNIRNDGTGTITLDPNSTETIDGTLTQSLRPGESCAIACNGSAFKTVGLRRQDAIAVGRNILARTNASTPNSKIDISADELVLKDANGNTFTAASVSVTIDMATSGANGLDTGAEASNTWYYGWVLAKGDGTICGVASTSSSAPTLPTDYVYKALVTAVRNDGSSNFITYRQVGRRAYYEAAQQVVSTNAPSTVEQTQSVSSQVPSIAQEMDLEMDVSISAGGSGLVSHSLLWKFATGQTCQTSKIVAQTGLNDGEADHVTLPNVSQQFFYNMSNNTNVSSETLTINCTGFTLPVGGE